MQCSKNYFKVSLSQETGTSGNNIRKEPQKPCPMLKKYSFYTAWKVSKYGVILVRIFLHSK